jgi:hypothetical protein
MPWVYASSIQRVANAAEVEQFGALPRLGNFRDLLLFVLFFSSFSGEEMKQARGKRGRT